jgi:hypothetical protein
MPAHASRTLCIKDAALTCHSASADEFDVMQIQELQLELAEAKGVMETSVDREKKYRADVRHQIANAYLATFISLYLSLSLSFSYLFLRTQSAT